MALREVLLLSMDPRNMKTEVTKCVYRTPNFVTKVPTLVVVISDVFVAEGLSNVSSAAAKSWLSEIRRPASWSGGQSF